MIFYGLPFLIFLSSLYIRLCVSESQCKSTDDGDIFFSVSSKRNLTGHWNALVHLQHGADSEISDYTESGSWNIDIVQSTEKCEKGERVNIVAKVTAPPQKAGPGYEMVPGLGYYKLHTTVKTWAEARDICRQEGGHLAIINSEKELKALHGILDIFPTITSGWQNDNAFVGFHDRFVEGQYITIFGDSLESTGYSQFAPGEPTDKTANGGQDCGCVHRNQPLHDVGCNARLPFFCEQEAY